MAAGSVTTSGSAALPALNQAVYIDGAYRPDVYCTSIESGGGTAGSTASLELPAMYWDGGKGAFRGKSVEVHVGYSGNRDVVFCGWISATTGNAAAQSVTASAVSLLGLSDAVYIGQSDGDKDQVYEYSGVGLRAVLRDIILRLPSQYRSVLTFGVLTPELDEAPIGDLTFRQSTLRDALDQCLGLAGNVSIRETFRAGCNVTLDFFKLHDASAPARRMVVAGPGERAYAGNNVLDISDNDSLDGVRTRIIALGDLAKTMLTVTSDAGTPAHGLRRAWSQWMEPYVLKNPERKAELDGSKMPLPEGIDNVFRRYVLPSILDGRTILDNNALQVTDGTSTEGKPLPVQVWKEYPALVEQPDGSWIANGATTRELLSGADLHLSEGWLMLSEPCVYLASSTVGSAEVETEEPTEPEEPVEPEEGEEPPEPPATEVKFRIIDVYAEARLCITLTVAGKRMRVDTGSVPDGFTLSRIGGDGLTETVVNETFQRIDIGGWLADPTLAGLLCTYYLPGDSWVIVATPEIYADDTADLSAFAQAALREKNRIKTNYSITLPIWTNTIRIGDRVDVVGQRDYAYGVHTIQSLSHTLGHDYGTTISTDTSVPLLNSDILGGG
jgi:hypothetical protein